MEIKVYTTKERYIRAMDWILSHFDEYKVMRYKLTHNMDIPGSYFIDDETIRVNLPRLYHEVQFSKEWYEFIKVCESNTFDRFIQCYCITICHEVLHHVFNIYDLEDDQKKEHLMIRAVTNYLFPGVL